MTVLTSLRQPNPRAATVGFTFGPCRFPPRLVETTMRSSARYAVQPHRPPLHIGCGKKHPDLEARALRVKILKPPLISFESTACDKTRNKKHGLTISFNRQKVIAQ